MQVDDPPYLPVGTAVSAKYKGAFCEAKVSKVTRSVKCKVTYKMGLGTATVSDNDIKGTLRVGHTVQVRHPDKKEYIEAVIGKIQDCSQYTVVFDDGDITTLRRTALCLKSGRHFNESETLDQLPLTHPEHFGNPVMGGRRGRRNRQLKEESSDGEGEEETEPDLEGYSSDIGRVVLVESAEKKRNRDNWFPGLIVIPSAQPTVRINVKDEFLVRSFRDDRYYTVPKKEVREFTRNLENRVESVAQGEGVNKAIKYLDTNELPAHWERNSLFNMQPIESESEDNFSDSSDDEPNEEKDRFVAQLYKFMDDSGTPLNKIPMIGNKDVDLHRLFRAVQKLGGYNRVTNQNKWRAITNHLRLPNNNNTFNMVKGVYKRCLYSYEGFYKTLGVTMLNHTRSNKKNRGRSLIRDKDRATPVNSPKVDKDDDNSTDNNTKNDEKPTTTVVQTKEEETKKKKVDTKKDDEKKTATKDVIENSDTNSSDATDQSESLPSSSKETTRPRRSEKAAKEKRTKQVVEKEKAKPIEKPEVKKEEEEKQHTRSKSQTPKAKETVKKEPKTPATNEKIPATRQPPSRKIDEEKKKTSRKKGTNDEKTGAETSDVGAINIGDKLKVYYGPTHESKVTYEAKVIEIDKDPSGPVYLVHYTGWNTRYDEWISPSRIAENLSATTKAKRMKQTASGGNSSNSKTPTTKAATKRGRGMSITGRSTAVDLPPRSTTPSSVTSSSSRTKTPPTPATRSASRLVRQDYGRKTRRSSAQTDNSNHSDSESEISEPENELTRTRSGSKAEEIEVKTYKKKPVRATSAAKTDKSTKEKEEAESEKDDENERTKRTKKLKKSPDKSTEESDDDNSVNPPPKGRDFDLNQIRSELKGFSKAIKVPSIDSNDKENSSSSDDSNAVPIKLESVEEKQEKIEKSPSSDDIYEFKEPEPFEFESRAKLSDDKNKKRLVPRVYDDIDKSPKRKIIKSPSKSDKESPEVDKKRFRKTPLRKTEESDEEQKQDEDPFDKLVESPSYNILHKSASSVTATSTTTVEKIDKLAENKQKVVRNILESPLSLFRDLRDDDYSQDMDLSDTESQTQPIFTSRDDSLYSSDPFSSKLQTTSDLNSINLNMDFNSKSSEELKKESLDFEMIRESIAKKIGRQNSSDDSNDDSDDEMLVTHTSSRYQGKKKPLDLVEKPKTEPTPAVIAEIKEEPVRKSPIISPALQETDSSLLESICSSQPASITKLEETIKVDTSLKTAGPKIAESILQKFNSIKNNPIKSPKCGGESDTEIEVKSDSIVGKIKLEEKINKPIEPAKIELKQKPAEIVAAAAEIKKVLPPSTKPIESSTSTIELKKKRKVLSKPYIEESDSDSTDSEQLVIARSDEDSQTNSLDKPDLKESDSNLSVVPLATITDDSQSQQEEPRNFKFDNIEKEAPSPVQTPITTTTPSTTILSTSAPVATIPAAIPSSIITTTTITTVVKENVPAQEPEGAKEEELHSLLMCEETIPRSPAPVSESTNTSESRQSKASKMDLEMPFASAPGTSNNQKILINNDIKPVNKTVVMPPIENRSSSSNNNNNENREREAATVLENTPPTTPESTISNLSPRGDLVDLSPNTVENESGKSNDAEPEFSRKRLSANKSSLYSEEDSQNISEPSPPKKLKEDSTTLPATCKKRRKSARGADDAPPAKRGRKPLNRSRHNSDSDDTSEHSMGDSTQHSGISNCDGTSRSPRPSKYNFYVEFDPSLDRGQRIAILTQKLSEVRKTYAEVKAELAAVERRRKKIRKREREALKVSKQEMACA